MIPYRIFSTCFDKGMSIVYSWSQTNWSEKQVEQWDDVLVPSFWMIHTAVLQLTFRHWAMSRDQVPFDPKNRGEPIDFRWFQYHHWSLGNLTEPMLSENFACVVVVLILRCHLDVLNLSIPFPACQNLRVQHLLLWIAWEISWNLIVRCSETISDSEILEAIPVRNARTSRQCACWLDWLVILILVSWTGDDNDDSTQMHTVSYVSHSYYI